MVDSVGKMSEKNHYEEYSKWCIYVNYFYAAVSLVMIAAVIFIFDEVYERSKNDILKFYAAVCILTALVLCI